MTERITADRDATWGRVTTGVLLVLLTLSVVIQLVVLYAPTAPGVAPFPNSDKMIHLLVFAVPAALALLAGIRPAMVLTVLGAHAVLSEVIQGVFLPGRSGDPLDAVADLTGIAVAFGAVYLFRHRTRLPRT